MAQETISGLNKEIEGLRQQVAHLQQLLGDAGPSTFESAMGQLFQLFTAQPSKKEFLHAAANLLLKKTGCKNIGIRLLDQRGYIPYETVIGFDELFVKSECWLSVTTDQCACVRAILGTKLQHDSTLCTEFGSFVCNDLKGFVAQLSSEQGANFKQTCLKFGISSFAIVPIRYKQTTIGALQLADERMNIFPATSVEMLEKLSPFLGDIIQKLVAEEALRASEESLRSILESAADIILMMDLNGRYIYYNGVSILGLATADVIGKRPIDIFDEPQANMIMKHHDEVVATGNVVSYEQSFLWKGQHIYFLCHAYPVRNSEEAIIAVGTIGRNINDQKKIEYELRVSEERYHNLFDSTSAMWEATFLPLRQEIASLKKQGVNLVSYLEQNPDFVERAADLVTIINVNDECARLLRARKKEEVFGPLSRFLTPESIRTLIEGLLAYAAGSSFFEAETEISTCAGTTLRVLVRISIPAADSRYENLIATLIDVTERRLVETEALRAQKLESLGLLAGGIAHDFNNLLTAILGNASLAKSYLSPSDEAYQLLVEAEKATFNTKVLTKQLLTFAKGGAPIKKAGSIAEVIENATSFAMHGSNVKCVISIPQNLHAVEMDSDLIGQVINNILINADQAMPFGGTITIDAENIEIGEDSILPLKHGNYVKVSIRDQGKGISENDMKKIFDPYFTTRRGGTGLGLAISHSIIKRHDGHISAESTPGAGTVFHLYLPASHQVTQAVDEGNIVPGKGKILFIDDERKIRKIALSMLWGLGYSADGAVSGTQGLLLYGEAMKSGNKYDAVILDLTIPGDMGGKESIAKLLEMDPDARAIVSSGYSNDPIMANYTDYGFVGILSKPYGLKDLSEAVAKALSSISNPAHNKPSHIS